MTIALGAILIGWAAALVLGVVWAASGLCPPPYSGPRTPRADQPHITRFSAGVPAMKGFFQ